MAFILAGIVVITSLLLRAHVLVDSAPVFDEPSNLFNAIHHRQTGFWYDDDRHPPLMLRLIGVLAPALGSFEDAPTFAKDPTRFTNKYSYRLDQFSGTKADLTVTRLRLAFQLFWLLAVGALACLALRLGMPAPGVTMFAALLFLDPFWLSLSSVSGNDVMAFALSCVGAAAFSTARRTRTRWAVVSFLFFSAAWATKLTTALWVLPLLLGVATRKLPRLTLACWALGILGGAALSAALGQPSFLKSVHESNLRETFLLGHLFETTPLAYFPVAVLAKTSLAFLLVLGLGLWHTRKRRRELRRAGLLATALLAGLLAAGFILPGLGARLVLPLIVTAWFCAGFLVRKPALATAAIALLLAEATLSRHGLAAHQNPLLGTTPLTLDSDCDWGQGLKALAEWRRAHTDAPLALAHFGGTWPEIYGLTDYLELPSFPVIGRRPAPRKGQFHGYVAASRNFLYGYAVHQPFLTSLAPVEPLECFENALCVYDFRR